MFVPDSEFQNVVVWGHLVLRKPESQSRNAVSKPDSAAITCESARPEASPCWLAAAMFIGAPEVARTPSSLTL